MKIEQSIRGLIRGGKLKDASFDPYPEFKDGGIIKRTNFDNVDFKSIFQDVTFHVCTFKNCRFPNSFSFNRCYFSLCSFEGCTFPRLSIENSYLKSCNFKLKESSSKIIENDIYFKQSFIDHTAFISDYKLRLVFSECMLIQNVFDEDIENSYYFSRVNNLSNALSGTVKGLQDTYIRNEDIFQVTNVGGSCRILSVEAIGDFDKWIWSTGCFRGTYKELMERVSEKYPKGSSYHSAIEFLVKQVIIKRYEQRTFEQIIE